MDFASFFHYLGLAAKNISPRSRKPLPHLTSDHMLSLSAFSLRYFENLFSIIPRPALIVFDNYHCLPENSPLHTILVSVFERLPSDINIIVLSRAEPPSTYAKLRAQNAISFMGYESIKFTQDETSEFITKAHQNNIHPELLIRLQKKTDGWIAGLVLMTEHSRVHDLDKEKIDNIPKETLFDYFANEILVDMDNSDQKILVASALLPEMTPSTLNKLTKSHHSLALIKELNRKSYFISLHNGTEETYQYHPLFRDFLLARANSYFSDQEIIDLKICASEILVEVGSLEDAWKLLIDLQKWESLKTLLLYHANSLVMQGRIQSLNTWLSHIPDIKTDPWLLYWRGACQMFIDPASAQSDFSTAYTLFHSINDVEGLYLSWCVTMECMLLQLKGSTELNGWLDEFDTLRQRHAKFPNIEIEARVAYCAASSMIQLRPNHPNFSTWMARAVELLPHLPGTNTRLKAAAELGYKNTWLGDYALAKQLLREAHRLASQPDAAPVLTTMLLTFSAILSWGDSSSTKQWPKVLEEAWKNQEQLDVPIWGPFLLLCSIFGNLIDGNVLAAEKMTQQLSDLKHDGGAIDPIKLHAPALLAYHQGDFVSALEYADISLKKGSSTGNFFIDAMGYILVSQLHYELGNTELAWSHFRSGKKIAEEMNSRSLLDIFLLVEARILLESGNKSAGLLSLRNSLVLNKNMGAPCTPYVTRTVLTQIYTTALTENIEVSHVCELIKRRKLIPESPPIEIENWPWTLKIYTLGRFSVLKENRPLAVSRKTPRKCLELLKSIIALGGRDVSLAKLASVLWHDIDGDIGLQSLKTTVHRLRKLLGNDDALIIKDGQISLNAHICWVDAWAFERHSKLTDEIIESGISDSIEQQTATLFNLYYGAFLEREPELTITSVLREKLRSLFLRKVTKISDHWISVGSWDKAVDCCTKALEVEPLAEVLYQNLMLYYMRNNRFSDALASYNRCRSVLQSSLGINPSPDTEEIRSQLTSLG